MDTKELLIVWRWRWQRWCGCSGLPDCMSESSPIWFERILRLFLVIGQYKKEFYHHLCDCLVGISWICLQVPLHRIQLYLHLNSNFQKLKSLNFCIFALKSQLATARYKEWQIFCYHLYIYKGNKQTNCSHPVLNKQMPQSKEMYCRQTFVVSNLNIDCSLSKRQVNDVAENKTMLLSSRCRQYCS